MACIQIQTSKIALINLVIVDTSALIPKLPLRVKCKLTRSVLTAELIRQMEEYSKVRPQGLHGRLIKTLNANSCYPLKEATLSVDYLIVLTPDNINNKCNPVCALYNNNKQLMYICAMSKNDLDHFASQNTHLKRLNESELYNRIMNDIKPWLTRIS
eukprot:NODE_100_length_20777_cov_0.240884.p12 type:complete len:157 gc:universal NODE_100_length_20777_cov_0.240884:11711-11241(-)